MQRVCIILVAIFCQSCALTPCGRAAADLTYLVVYIKTQNKIKAHIAANIGAEYGDYVCISH